MAGKADHSGHRARLKTRFLRDGLSNFEPHNVIELILFYALPYKDTNDVAHAIMEHFGSISAVFDAPVSELVKVKGVSEHTAILFKMIPALFSRYSDDKNSDVNELVTLEDAGRFLVGKFAGVMNESAIAVLMNNKCKVLGCEFIGEGISNATSISIRKMIELCIKYNATTVIVSHNHPNGFAIPSRKDINTTQEIVEALDVINVRLLDHIIVAPDDFVSLASSSDYKFLFS